MESYTDRLSPFGLLYQNRNVFFTVLEAGSPRSVFQHGHVGALFRVQTFHGVLTWWKGLGSSVVSLL